MSSNKDGRATPFIVCGLVSACLAALSVASRNLYAEPDQSVVAASSLAIAGCASIAWLVKSRPTAWRYLWLVVAALCGVAAYEVFKGFLGTPSELIPRTRGENAPGLAFFVLLGDIFMGMLGPGVLVVLGLVALVLSWLLGRQQRPGSEPGWHGR